MLIILDATLTVRTELSISFTVYKFIFVISAVNNMFYSLEKGSNALVYSFANFLGRVPYVNDKTFTLMQNKITAKRRLNIYVFNDAMLLFVTDSATIKFKF